MIININIISFIFIIGMFNNDSRIQCIQIKGGTSNFKE